MSSTAPRVVVVGAGAFGGWTALELTRRGASVTLVDAWGPGNGRASSGGETRLIRASYGRRVHYTRMARRALQIWRARENEWQRRFFFRTGVLLMIAGESAFGRDSEAALRAEGGILEPISIPDAQRRYPRIAFEGVSSVFLEPDAGYLLARQACVHVVERLIAAGGTYRVGAAASPVSLDGGALAQLALEDGTSVEGDAFVFACGAWLGTMFPDVIGAGIRATRQAVYYFGPPAGDPLFTEDALPAWIDFGERQIYGVPGNAHRGFKVADDTAGPPMDPTTGERDTTADGVAAARRFLAQRFPALARAPLLGSEICQYEATPDSDFVVDRHPRAPNVWIIGGGSGHGFKMGPAIGEIVAPLVLGESEPDPRFGLARLSAPPVSGWPEKWT